MPQSLAAVYLHLVFSTKERRPFLRDSAVRDALYSHLGILSRNLECPPLRIGGHHDHVHILARFARNLTQADWVKELKRGSTLWLKDRYPDLATFHWQSGYACFSVSQSNLQQVIDYIERQEYHHRAMSLQDELRALLQKHEIEFDERYIWNRPRPFPRPGQSHRGSRPALGDSLPGRIEWSDHDQRTRPCCAQE